MSSVEEVVVREIQRLGSSRSRIQERREGGTTSCKNVFVKRETINSIIVGAHRKAYIIIIILIRFVRARERERVVEDEQRAR